MPHDRVTLSTISAFVFFFLRAINVKINEKYFTLRNLNAWSAGVLGFIHFHSTHFTCMGSKIIISFFFSSSSSSSF